MMKMKYRKNILITITILLAVSALLYGGYRLSHNRALEQLSRFVQILDDIYGNTADENEQDPPATIPEDVPDGEGEKLPADGDSDRHPEQTDRRESPADGDSPQDDPETPTPLPPVEESPDPPQEEPPPKRHAIFGYMPVEDQSYLLGISNRFSLKEIRQILDSYETGGDSWEASKQLIHSRVSQEEITRIQFLINEYIL